MAKKKNDPMIMFIRIMNIVVWCLMFAALIFFDQARPEVPTILDARYSKESREYWDYTYASISMWIFIGITIISSISLFINLIALSTGKYRVSRGLSLALVISLGASIAYMVMLL